MTHHRLNNFVFRESRRNVRDDIQFLRAIAVLAVVIYHLWPNRLPGGFVGVDVFFVVSGYLMTASLVKGLQNGGAEKGERLKFLAAFYARRIRRLLPAAFVLLGTTTVVFFLLFGDKYYLLSVTFSHVLASTLFSQNWLLAVSSVDYLAQSNEPTAVEHFWSLSLEEQFYLGWPLFLLISVILVTGRSGKGIALIWPILAVTLASLGFGVYLTIADPSQAYFVTPARLWELSLGGMVAVLLQALESRDLNEGNSLRTARKSRIFLQFLGLFICLATIIFFDSELISFPGVWALLPTVGTALILFGGSKIANGTSEAPLSLFRLRPFQFIGDISYSFYLWHFVCIKAFVLFRLYYGDATVYTLEKVLIILPASLVLSTLSYYFVEQFFLHNATQKQLFAFVGILGLCLVFSTIYGYQYAVKNGAHARDEFRVSIRDGIQNYRSKSPPTSSTCIGAMSLDAGAGCTERFGVLDGRLLNDVERDYDLAVEKRCDKIKDRDATEVCIFGNEGSTRSVLLWGDSHAMQYADALSEAADILDIKLVVATRSACPPMLFSEDEAERYFVFPSFGYQNRVGCIVRNNYILKSDEYLKADLVLLVSAGFTSPKFQLLAQNAANFKSKSTAIVQNPPNIINYPEKISSTVSNKQVQMLRMGIYYVDEEDVDLGTDFVTSARNANGDLRYIKTVDNFCSEGKCYLAVGGIPVYRDTHLSGLYSKSLGPWFAKILQNNFPLLKSAK